MNIKAGNCDKNKDWSYRILAEFVGLVVCDLVTKTSLFTGRPAILLLLMFALVHISVNECFADPIF